MLLNPCDEFLFPLEARPKVNARLFSRAQNCGDLLRVVRTSRGVGIQRLEMMLSIFAQPNKVGIS